MMTGVRRGPDRKAWKPCAIPEMLTCELIYCYRLAVEIANIEG